MLELVHLGVGVTGAVTGGLTVGMGVTVGLGLVVGAVEGRAKALKVVQLIARGARIANNKKMEAIRD